MARQFEEQVRRGITLLDQRRPNWRERVKLDKLAMDSCDACILGQVYGDYDIGLDCLHLRNGPTEIRANHGFSIYYHPEWRDWSELAEEWRRQIRETEEPVPCLTITYTISEQPCQT